MAGRERKTFAHASGCPVRLGAQTEEITVKRLTRIVALGAASALALAACASAPDDKTPSTPPAPGAASPSTSAPATVDFTGCMVSDEGGFDDASFNQSGYEGLQRAVKELGIKEKHAESAGPGDFAGNVDSMVQQQCDLTIGVGFALEDTIQAAADKNPDMHFALVDSAFSDKDFKPVKVANAKPLLFNTQEAAFLAGYLAAGVSKTGVVGTYGGMQFPSVTIFMDGFADGVAQYNKDNSKSVKVLGWNKATQKGEFTGDFQNVDKGKTTTETFIAADADVILPVAGPVGEGSLNAAKEAGNVSVIWVDSDGYMQPKNDKYKDLILTSVIKQIGNSVFDVLKASSSGSFTADPYVGTLDNGGVALAPYHDWDAKIDAKLKAKIDELKAAIIAGTLKVESPSAS